MSMGILYTDGKFYLGDGQYADALFSKEGKIAAIGDINQIGDYKDEANKIIRLEDRFVYPDYTGFIKNVEYDFEEIKDDLLVLYDKKMSKKVSSESDLKGFQIGEETNMAIYDKELINLIPGAIMEAKRLIVGDEVVYDEEDYLDEQMYRLLITQQY